MKPLEINRKKINHSRCKSKIKRLEKRISNLQAVLRQVCNMSDMAGRIRQFVERNLQK